MSVTNRLYHVVSSFLNPTDGKVDGRVRKEVWETGILTTPSYTSGQKSRGISPFSSKPALGSIFGTAAWESARHVMLNMIPVVLGQIWGTALMLCAAPSIAMVEVEEW
jgi:hypothetical protein